MASPLRKVRFAEIGKYELVGRVIEVVKQFRFVCKVVAVASLSECNGRRVFSFNLEDESGVVRCVCYDDNASKYSQLIRVPMVLQLCNVKLQLVRDHLTGLDGEFKIEITDETTIVEVVVPHGMNVRLESYFTQFCDIWEKAIDRPINIAGIVQSIGDLEIFSPGYRRRSKKRVINLIDEYKQTLRFILWDDLAESWKYLVKDVLTITCVYLNECDCSGCTLDECAGERFVESFGSTVIMKNARNLRSRRLRAAFSRLFNE